MSYDFDVFNLNCVDAVQEKLPTETGAMLPTETGATLPTETGAMDETQSQQTLLEMFGEPVGNSFESSEESENLSDSSDFEIADCDLSSKIMHAIQPVKENKNNACANAVHDQFDFSTEDEDLEKLTDDPKKVENVKKKFCCNNLCCDQNFSVQFYKKMEEILGKSKTERKQFLLDHLIKQEELGVSTSGFQFYGIFLCKKAFVEISGVSNYLVVEACKGFEIGQTVFHHGNSVGMRETEATLGFIIWMKQHAVNFGNQAPDEETLVLPACYHLTDLFQQYESEAPLPRIKRSTFYRLFDLKFGPYREDKNLPRIRISNYSTHSKCETCLSLNKFQKSCKKLEDLELVKSMKQRHKSTYQSSYQAIQEKRFQALSDPENFLHLQGLESFASVIILTFLIWRVIYTFKWCHT